MYKPTTSVWQPSASFLFKLSIITSAIAGLGLTTGCSSTPTSSKTQNTKQLGLLDASSLDSLEDLLSATDMRAVEGDRLLILKHGDVWKRMTVGFKMDETKWDPRIEAQRSWFITRQPYLDRLSARASRYLYHTVKEAERRGMPTELALLPVIESSYDPAATSTAAAAGMWQFIPSTGKIYGLRQNSMYDGRRDVVESTRAAYEFLGSLYNQFGSWELALAAYNAGPGRIQQAINRNKAAGLPTDYWSLKLPQETMNYVPRFLAVAQIIKSPHKYGVNLPPIANRPHFREVTVPAGSQLSQIASITGLSRAELYQLNPGHRGEIVDAQSTLKILIPADLNPSIDAKLRAMKPSAGGFLASTVSTTQSPTTNTPSYSTTRVSTTTTPSSNTASSATTSTTFVKAKTPSGSNALAAFASSSAVPSAPRIPVAVTPAANVQQVSTEPKLTEEERAKVLASLNPPATTITTKITPATSTVTTPSATGTTSTTITATTPSASTTTPITTTTTLTMPTATPAATTSTTTSTEIASVVVEDESNSELQATQAEKEEVVREITAIAPQGTEIVDPLDGKIKLTAIQTSQSTAAEKGQELKVGFSYPKSVAENTGANSDEAKLNIDKSYLKTDNDFVVVPPKGKRSTYSVLPGDTLAVIAMKNGLNWRDIAKWNQIDPNATLFVGASLYLYDAKPVADKKVEEKPTSYVVKPNDSLSAVADQFNLSIQQLADFNNLSTTSNLMVGQKLSLIESNTKKTDKTKNTDNKAASKAANIKTKVYTVKRGEYLKLIADRFALSNQELASLTPELKSDSSLFVGQKINVPLEDVNSKATESTQKVESSSTSSKSKSDVKTESYKVERGDTLYSIAMKSKMTLGELAELNGLSTNKALMAGQTIQVPVGVSTPSIYTVQSGDSLHAVAGKYNLPVSQIANLNGLSTSAGLSVGQKLKLSGEPEAQASSQVKSSVKDSDQTSSADASTHVVGAGETLASIARKYKLQLKYLTELNDLSNNSNLRVGQRLKIDGDIVNKTSNSATNNIKSKNTETYSVKAGESLNVIASRIGLTVKELADLNDLTPRSGLQRGQTLQIPKTIVEYKIRSGDSLHRIASRYGIETSQLAEMNDLKINAPLQIGDTIKVPNL